MKKQELLDLNQANILDAQPYIDDTNHDTVNKAFINEFFSNAPVAQEQNDAGTILTSVSLPQPIVFSFKIWKQGRTVNVLGSLRLSDPGVAQDAEIFQIIDPTYLGSGFLIGRTLSGTPMKLNISGNKLKSAFNVITTAEIFFNCSYPLND